MSMLERNSIGFRFTVLGAWIAVLFLLLPIAVVVPVSFTPQRYLSLPGAELSLRHYKALLADPQWLRSIMDSLIVGLSATTLAVLLGTMCAIGCWRISTRPPEILALIVLGPLIVPANGRPLGFFPAWGQ